MRRLSPLTRSAACAVGLFILLAAPWPGWRTFYCKYLLAVAQEVFPAHGAVLDLEFHAEREAETPESEARIVIVNRALMAPDGSGPVRNLVIDLGRLGATSFALLLSLCAATPVSWRRRLAAAGAGAVLLHVAILVSLAIGIHAEASELGVGGLGPAGRDMAHRLELEFAALFSISIPVLIWMVTMSWDGALMSCLRPGVGASKKDEARAVKKNRDASQAAAAMLLALSFLMCGKSLGEDAGQMPPELARQFQPPAKYKDDFGNYRSPLVFDDGTKVKTPEDWQRRRAEIRRDWDDILGAWPPLVEKPSVTVLSATDRENFSQETVRVQIAPRQTLDGYLLIPKGLNEGAGKTPAVLVTGVDPETSVGLHVPLRDFALQLARRGYVTMAIGAPGGNPRAPQMTDAKCQPLSYLAYIAANCANALANMPEVDPARIGIVGHAYGGKWALFASCMCDRFACAAWSEAGVVFDERKPNVDYYNPWYLGTFDGTREERPERLAETIVNRRGAYRTLYNRRMDLTDMEALMAPRPFLVSAGSGRTYGAFFASADTEARWPALNHSIAVNQLLGYANRVGMTNRFTHEPTPESNEEIFGFFDYFLKMTPKSAGSAGYKTNIKLNFESANMLNRTLNGND